MDWLGLDPARTLSFIVACILIEITPGPNMTYLALVAARDGRRAGYATVAGIALGLAIIGCVASIGVAEIVRNSEFVYQALRWAGVAFLLYLAWEGWVAGADVVAGQQVQVGRRNNFGRGLLTNILNPKAAAFYIVVLPTFVEPTQPMLAQTLSLTAIYVAIATAIHAAIVTLAGSFQTFLEHPDRERTARRVLSAMLALVALWFAWSTAR